MKPIAFFFLLLFFVGCKTIPSYLDVNSPVWVQNSNSFVPSDSTISVVSFNLENGINLFAALSELQTLQEKIDPEIILLQEVDEGGVKTIADSLNYNFVYFPISYQEKYKQNYGNAILCKFKIESSKKIILPHEKFLNQRRRAVTQATVLVDGGPLHIYSVHLETIVMANQRRMDQLNTLIEEIEGHPVTHRLIIGGDFNTLSERFRNNVVSEFRKLGVDWESKDLGETSSAISGVVRIQNDHLFSRGFIQGDAGKLEEAQSSDHLPIWVRLTWN